jgi:hypothetical protein
MNRKLSVEKFTLVDMIQLITLCILETRMDTRKAYLRLVEIQMRPVLQV